MLVKTTQVKTMLLETTLVKTMLVKKEDDISWFEFWLRPQKTGKEAPVYQYYGIEVQGFPVLRGFRTWEKQLIVEIVLEIYLVLRLRAEDDVLCFEFWLRLTLGVLEKLGEAAALSRLRLTDVRVSCRYPGL